MSRNFLFYTLWEVRPENLIAVGDYGWNYYLSGNYVVCVPKPGQGKQRNASGFGDLNYFRTTKSLWPKNYRLTALGKSLVR